jgi:hypothetical protein
MTNQTESQQLKAEMDAARKAAQADADAIKALRKRIERLEQRLMCRGGPDAHYCSHCDNSLWVDDIHGDALRMHKAARKAEGEK